MAGYTRQAAANIVTGSVIDADDFNDEYNQVQSAFNASTGHTHDGTAGEGAPIETIGPSQDVVATASTLRPKTTNAVDLGTSALQYKDAYFDGAVRTDTLTVDENATIAGSLTVSGTFTDSGSGTQTAARAALSGGTGISYNNSSGVITCTIDTPAEVGLSNLSSNGNSLSGNFSVTGAITANGNITAFSDARLKDNVETIEGALDKVSQMRGVMYDKDGERGTGVIAQEMQQVMPEVVQEGEYLSVAYGNIVGVLIESIKELKTQIEELKNGSSD
tara:strand:+ start:2677 stop:3504 length:828 start_codon:yes stop_codon:yes gene_type:complete